MTFREPKTKTKAARALRNPKPSFVSIVKAGASQIPLRTVKADQLTIQETEAMTTINAMRADGHEVVKIVLRKGDRFPDEAAAKAWLEEGGYPLDAIKETKTGFTLTNTEDSFDETEKIEVDSDITVTVGKLEITADAETDADAEAAKKANNSGSAITDVEKAHGKDKKKADADDDSEGAADAEADAAEADAEDDDTEESTYMKSVHGIDGKNKEVVVRTRTRKKTSRKAMSARQMQREGVDPETEATADGEADTNEAEETAATRASIHVKDGETYEFDLLNDETAKELQIPEGSFEVTDKVELLFGDCGPGHVMLNVGGRTVCVPTGDVSGITQDEEVNAPAASGGQGSAGFGGTGPAAGQVQRDDSEDDDEGDGGSAETPAGISGHDLSTDMAKKFDDFSAHFSDGQTIKDVMDDANDGIPPGFESIVFAMVTAMRNNFLEGDVSAVRSVGTEFGEIAARLGELFGEEIERGAKKTAIDAVSGIFAEIGWEADGDDEGSTAASSVQDETLAKMAQAVTDLAGSVQAGFTKITEQAAETATRVEALEGSDLTDRVEKVEDQTNKQTRKGVADGDLADGSTADVKRAEKRKEFAKRNLRNQLGSTNTRG